MSRIRGSVISLFLTSLACLGLSGCYNLLRALSTPDQAASEAGGQVMNSAARNVASGGAAADLVGSQDTASDIDRILKENEGMSSENREGLVGLRNSMQERSDQQNRAMMANQKQPLRFQDPGQQRHVFEIGVAGPPSRQGEPLALLGPGGPVNRNTRLVRVDPPNSFENPVHRRENWRRVAPSNRSLEDPAGIVPLMEVRGNQVRFFDR